MYERICNGDRETEIMSEWVESPQLHIIGIITSGFKPSALRGNEAIASLSDNSDIMRNFRFAKTQINKMYGGEQNDKTQTIKI